MVKETRMKPRNCPQCNNVMTESIENYNIHHKTCNDYESYRNVTLIDIEINRCPCGEMVVTIPKIGRLYSLLDRYPHTIRATYEKKLEEWIIVS